MSDLEGIDTLDEEAASLKVQLQGNKLLLYFDIHCSIAFW